MSIVYLFQMLSAYPSAHVLHSLVCRTALRLFYRHCARAILLVKPSMSEVALIDNRSVKLYCRKHIIYMHENHNK